MRGLKHKFPRLLNFGSRGKGYSARLGQLDAFHIVEAGDIHGGGQAVDLQAGEEGALGAVQQVLQEGSQIGAEAHRAAVFLGYPDSQLHIVNGAAAFGLGRPQGIREQGAGYLQDEEVWRFVPSAGRCISLSGDNYAGTRAGRRLLDPSHRA